jgi:choline kinase
MKAVILAAGISSRLRPLTDTTPKCLLTLGGKTILGRMLDNLAMHGITDLVMVTGYRERQIKTFVSDYFPHLKVAFVTNERYHSTNNIYSLWLTRELVRHDEMLLLDSDIVFDQRIIGLLLTASHENCLAVKRGDKLGAEEIKVRVGADGSIEKIGKEVDPGEAAGESIGIEKFGQEFVGELLKVLERKMLIDKSVNQFYEAAFQEVIDNCLKVYPVDVGSCCCIEIDTPEDLDAAQQSVIASIF